MTFKRTINWGVYGFRKVTQMTQVSTYERQHCFGRLYIFNLTDFFYGFRLKNIASQTINSISRINDNAPRFQTFYNLFDEAFLWILRVNLYNHILQFKTNNIEEERNEDFISYFCSVFSNFQNSFICH